MTNQQHLITPPPELLQLWFEQHHDYSKGINELLIEAVQYGADRELEACCEWLATNRHILVEPALRAARRKPPSLKEQALALLDKAEDPSWDINDFSIVRKALEQLPE